MHALLSAFALFAVPLVSRAAGPSHAAVRTRPAQEVLEPTGDIADTATAAHVDATPRVSVVALIPEGDMRTCPPAAISSESPVLPTVAHLLAAAQAGESTEVREAALEAMLTCLHAPLLEFSLGRLRRCRDAADLAADVAQETLIRLAKSAATCRATTEAQVVAWALTVARHVLADYWRSPARRLAAAERAADTLAECADAGAIEDEWRALSTSFEESAGHPDAESRGAVILQRLAVEALDAYDATRSGLAALCWTRLVAGAEWADAARDGGTTTDGLRRRWQRAQATLRRDVLRRVAALEAADRRAAEAFLSRCGVAP
jgi:DNA-directed RNA polymerase specialized sigma24 family protein